MPFERIAGEATGFDGHKVVLSLSFDRLSVQEANELNKTQARSLIVARYPDWKQANMIARAVELIGKGEASWNAEERQEATALRAAWSWIGAVRTRSDEIETAYAAGSAITLQTRQISGQGGWPEAV